tara:strand:- start:2677 stop:3675 length:999 start_codon:yes stop_codon:yes gene_type:complete
MLRKDVDCFYEKPPIIFNMDQIGIGMSVTMLPAILDIKQRTDQDIYVHCHEHHVNIIKYFIDEDNIYPYYDSNDPELHNDRIFVGQQDRDAVKYSCSVTQIPPHQCHPVDHFFHMLTGEIGVLNERKNYPKFPTEKVDISKFNLPDKFVVLGPGSTKPICQIAINPMNDIIRYCKSMDYEVVLLGGEYEFTIPTGTSLMKVGPVIPDTLFFDECINLIGKTDLAESIAILDKAHCYVGPEGGLMQFCGMTNTPMIIGINGWHPDMRMPYRNNKLGWECYPVVPDEDVECRFCIQKTLHAKTVNIMMECIYDDFKCVDNITFYKFKPYLDKIL